MGYAEENSSDTIWANICFGTFFACFEGMGKNASEQAYFLNIVFQFSWKNEKWITQNQKEYHFVNFNY